MTKVQKNFKKFEYIGMKALIFAISILIGLTTSAQETPFYEQIAFDYFLKEIYPKESIQIKIYLSDTLEDYLHSPWNWPVCLKNYSSTELESLNASDKHKIIILQNNGARIIKAKNKHQLNCYVVESIDMKNRNHVVNIVILKKHGNDIFYIELDNIGNVLSWCKGGRIE